MNIPAYQVLSEYQTRAMYQNALDIIAQSNIAVERGTADLSIITIHLLELY
jgi:hypothetical protein